MNASGGNRLRKLLGAAFGLAIVIGAVIGGGIMRTPGLLASELGNEALIIGALVLGAVWALLGANVYAELGTMIPRAGAGYVYLRRAYGEFVGFAGGINDFLINVCAIAYLSINAAEFGAELFPSIRGHEGGTACTLMATFSAVHWLGVRAGDRSQKLLSLLKFFTLALFAAACFAYGDVSDNPRNEHLVEFPSRLSFFVAAMLAFQVVNESYAGWNSPVYFSEESVDPSRTIPRAMVTGILIVAALYVAVFLAIMHVLPMSEIAGSKLPGAVAAAIVFGDSGRLILTVISIIATLGVLNAILMYAPRVPYAMARDGLLPARIMTVNRGGTPGIALLVLVVFATAAALSGTYESLLALAAFFSVVGDGFVLVALFVLRRREPALARPFRAVGYPWLPMLTVTVAILFLVGYVISNPRNSAIAICLLLLIYPLFLAFRKLSRR